jgi:hypothetical protein
MIRPQITFDSGKVGIRTTSPGRLLEVGVTGAAGVVGIARFSHSVGGNQRSWDIGVGEAASFGANDNFGIKDSSGGNTVLVIDTSGNVGIGTTSPGSYDGESRNLVIFSTTTPGLTIATSTTTSRCAIRFADGITGNETYRGGIEYDHGTGSGGTADSMHFRTAAAIRMSINGDGNVGIGTTSPTRPLSIKADSNGYNIGLNDSGDTERSWIYSNSTGSVWQTAASMKLQLNGSNGTGLIVDNASNVGIGIAAPGHKLNVYGTGNTAIEVQGNGTASLGYLSARADGDPVIQIGQFGSAATGTTFGIANTRLSVIYTTTYATTHPLGMAIGNTSDIPIYFATNQAVRFTIDGSSNTLTGNGASTIATSSGNLIFQPVGVLIVRNRRTTEWEQRFVE